MQIWVKRVEEIKLIDQKEVQTFISKIAKVCLHISKYHTLLIYMSLYYEFLF